MSTWEKELIPKQSILAGALSTAAAVFMTGGESLGGIAQAALTVGLPTIAGADVAAMALGSSTYGGASMEDVLVQGLVAGASAAGLLMMIGQLPAGLSSESLTVFLMAGAATAASKLVMSDL